MMQDTKKLEEGSAPRPMSMLRDLMKRIAHTLIFPAVEAGNAGILRIVGILLQPEAGTWQSNGLNRVLVLAPHPDDETLGCGGTIRLHLEAGDQVTVAILTDGRRSRAGGIKPEAMVQRRQREAENALAALASHSPGTGSPGAALSKIKLVQLGLPEGAWTSAELAGQLTTLLTSIKPSILYSPSLVDFHPEHLRVARVLAQVLRTDVSKIVRCIRAYELQVPLTPVLANLAAPINSTQQCKDSALACYRTQSGSFLWVPRHKRYLRALYRTERPVELFWEMVPRQFAAIHLESDGRFRNMRLRPLTDLAAWTIGLQTRRAFRRIATQSSQ